MAIPDGDCGASWACHKGSEFFAVYGEQDEYGYTYLTYKQRYGDLTLENAVAEDHSGSGRAIQQDWSAPLPPMWEWPRRRQALLPAKEAEQIVRGPLSGEIPVQLYTRIYQTDLCDHTGSCVSRLGCFYHIRLPVSS